MLTWARIHAREKPGHETVETLNHPGRCMTCGEVAPAAMVEVAGADDLAPTHGLTSWDF